MFAFRRFTVCQDRCAMKVGTDGVLLGAWAQGGDRILDVGTGTGLIALMMAQRFVHARVTAIDIDGSACLQAEENVAASPFADRVAVVHTSFQDYCLTQGRPHSFDAVISNPPFFENSLKSPDVRRTIARHSDSLTSSDLFRGVNLLLSDKGTFSVIVPVSLVEPFFSNAYFTGFYPCRQYYIKTTSGKPSKRCLLTFSRVRHEVVEKEEVVLQNGDGIRSEWYQQLTKEFYL